MFIRIITFLFSISKIFQLNQLKLYAFNFWLFYMTTLIEKIKKSSFKYFIPF